MAYRWNKRPTNICGSCSYTWNPRGHNVSGSCPRCGSRDVRLPSLGCSTGCLTALGKLFIAGVALVFLAGVVGSLARLDVYGVIALVIVIGGPVLLVLFVRKKIRLGRSVPRPSSTRLQ